MKTGMLAISAWALAGAASGQTEHDYWLVSSSMVHDQVYAVTFVDVNRIVDANNDVRRAWTITYPSPHAPSEIASVERLVSLEEYDCLRRRVRVLQTTRYPRSADSVPTLSNTPGEWSYSTPDTAGDHTLNFICETSEARAADQTVVHLRESETLEDAATVSFAHPELFSTQR